MTPKSNNMTPKSNNMTPKSNNMTPKSNNMTPKSNLNQREQYSFQMAVNKSNEQSRLLTDNNETSNDKNKNQDSKNLEKVDDNNKKIKINSNELNEIKELDESKETGNVNGNTNRNKIEQILKLIMT